MRVLVGFRSSSSPKNSVEIPLGPFNSFTQRRWKKAIDSAQTRLENRTRDLKLDELNSHLHKLNSALNLLHLMLSNRRCPFVSLQFTSRWDNTLRLSIPTNDFLRKYPHIFQIFSHPVKKNPCCRITPKMARLMEEEERAVRDSEFENVGRVKKLLMMSAGGTLHVHALGLVRRELGLPGDFRDSILRKYSYEFELVDLETVRLTESNAGLGPVAQVEKWRESEYRDKWVSEFETKYAFPMNFPTGFKKESGFKERLKNWQRLHYVKPYHRQEEAISSRSSGGIEKRVVGILHEFLSLTVEKRVEVGCLVHFRKDFGMERVNLRELLLKHPGIFYISTKGGNTQTVFLREAYHKGCLVEPNPIYSVWRKMLDLLLLGQRNTRELQPQ